MTNQKPIQSGSTNSAVYNDAVKIAKEKDFRTSNFFELKSTARTIVPTFGPSGLTKLIVQNNDEYRVTQKGYQIAATFTNQIPIVKMIKNLVNTQQKNCGDGTKTVLLLVGLMLEKAINLLEDGISPQMVNKGYFLAMNKGLEVIQNNFIPLTYQDDNIISHLIGSIITNKYGIRVKKYFIDLLLNLAKTKTSIASVLNESNLSDFYFRKVAGDGLTDSELIQGFIIYKGKPFNFVQDRILNPKIILVQTSIDYFINKNHSIPIDSLIENTTDQRNFTNFQHNYYNKLAETVKNKGIDVVLCQKKVNEEFTICCANLGMITLDLVGEEEIKKLSRMLNVNTISSINEISDDDIGIADLAEFKIVTKDEMFIIHKSDSNIVTFLLRGGTKHVLDELQESLETALQVAIQSVKNKGVLPGAGALELQLSHHIQFYSNNFSDKIQLVVSEYSKIFESLIGYIVLNSGEDPLTIIPNLKMHHASGKKHYGFDVNSKSIVDVIEQGILDDYFTKMHAIKIATETACQLIRIDDMIMVYDRRLFERKEQQGKQQKMEKRNEQMRKYFKKHEQDFSL